MRHQLQKKIINVLAMKPEGMKVSAIAVNIYNNDRDLFSEEKDFDKLYQLVRNYTWRLSQGKKSMLMAVEGKRGYYRLRNKQTTQCLLDFSQATDDMRVDKVSEPDFTKNMPSLFDFDDNM